MIGTPKMARVLAAAVALGVCQEAAWGAGGRIMGRGRFEKIKGNPSMGYVEAYECNMYFLPSDSSYIGPSRRLGTVWYNGSACYKTTNEGGAYCIDGLPAGLYSLVINQPKFFVAPKVIGNITIADDQTITLNPELPLDYSTYFKNDWTGGAGTWYQTFIATGDSIRGIAFSYANQNSPGSVEVAVLKDNGNPSVVNWQFVGSRTESSVADQTDNWVRWRSGEIPTVRGARYAVRLKANGGSGYIQPYKRNKDGSSYSGGQAYDSQGTAQTFDLCITVFTDNDGTIVTMNKRNDGFGFLCDEGFFGTRWGQTFIAKGTSLAAADVWAAGANEYWDLTFLWRVRQGGPTGPLVGPDKISRALSQASGCGHHGVSYNRREAPLTKGQTYFIEFNIYDPPPQSQGFNPYLMKSSPGATCDTGSETDQFDEGIAYRDNTARPNDDVSMTIIEYNGPEAGLDKDSITRNVYLGDDIDPDTFLVTNIGDQTLNYDVGDDAPWLEETPSSGSSTGESDLITVDYLTSLLAIGEYWATITVRGNAYNGPQTITVHLVVDTVTPDFDHDKDVDQNDFGHLQECFTGPGIKVSNPECLDACLDTDEDVDSEDFAILQGCMSGTNVPAERDCAG